MSESRGGEQHAVQSSSGPHLDASAAAKGLTKLLNRCLKLCCSFTDTNNSHYVDVESGSAATFVVVVRETLAVITSNKAEAGKEEEGEAG